VYNFPHVEKVERKVLLSIINVDNHINRHFIGESQIIVRDIEWGFFEQDVVCFHFKY